MYGQEAFKFMVFHHLLCFLLSKSHWVSLVYLRINRLLHFPLDDIAIKPRNPFFLQDSMNVFDGKKWKENFFHKPYLHKKIKIKFPCIEKRLFSFIFIFLRTTHTHVFLVHSHFHFLKNFWIILPGSWTTGWS